MTDDTTPPFVVAIGASAGGLQAIQDLLAELPDNFAAAVVIAQHSMPGAQLDQILRLKSPLPVRLLEDGDVLRAGTVYVTPAATHAFFQMETIRLSPEVKHAGYRPSIDALFMTLAASFRERAIAVVLSGTMKDGMRGAQVIHDTGGRTVVQNPDEAQFESMPMNVILMDHPQEILTASGLGKWLRDEVGTSPTTSD